MYKLSVCLLAGAVCLGLTFPATAQDIKVASTSLTRIVIAPPQTALARTIKSGLSAAYYGAKSNTAAYDEAQKLYFFYGERHFEPLWLTQSADGVLSFSPTAETIIKVFADAGDEGLRPKDYLTPDLDVVAATGDPAKMAALETAFSAALVRYADNLLNGRIRPGSISSDLDMAPKPLDATKLLLDIAKGQNPKTVLAKFEPRHREFLQLKAALADFDADADNQKIDIPSGPSLRLGMSDTRVALLRQRLEMTETAEDPSVYDKVVVSAVKDFQASKGLTSDGIAGPATVAALNGGPTVTRDDIIANMERWRWMPTDLGNFNVLVNVPEYRLSINQSGKSIYSTRVVVGSKAHPTPIFSNNIKHVVVNPYWNVPASIIKNEIAGKTLANPNYIASQNMDLIYKGNVINASQVNWSEVGNSFPFRVRQRPGAGNALGRIKFLFPNKHDVYLHDTPSKSLFSRSYRAYSHGCVRVQNPMDFADALMRNEPNISGASLASMFGSSERWVNPEHTIPVHIAYFTLRVQPDGTVTSYADVYGHNAKLIAALNK
ncbi:L,D-transpeptidase family protein [Devosia rhodophyticola]|uniref:L,D-transpeptidase family protein n=1 Tax=Devosia rhodophyticola TaxID=3026423 RepID=A0ABY7YU55_9HYPH|nr:L,D-transpeptidase family protein [Devosia rhodophyticola]WDR04883.1 L,D-transpeptidase family protein [Devosia rhodophyticola]